ncbi:DUF1102 domain-containing protein [Salinirubellus salinus]|uniref:DUF1102 domain-containing protein n=1 Tax=Salinirubellus salinus TaxID=1364945 RepID=A0A9E7R166_9EURY|nr:DUF1102 domain-containing protein [Salinirubellus salinus]UWM53727.1 DUF1102 domain-containing protein [Salinirubellus salinus]
MNIDKTGDASAYIALQRNGGSDGLDGTDDGTRHGNFVEYTGSPEQLEIDFSGDNPTSSRSGDPTQGNSLGGQGVNPNSTYYFDEVFDILNLANNTGSGVGEMDVWIQESIPGVTFYTGTENGGTSLINSNNKKQLSPGQPAKVGVKIVAADLPSANVDGTMVVHAESRNPD